MRCFLPTVRPELVNLKYGILYLLLDRKDLNVGFRDLSSTRNEAAKGKRKCPKKRWNQNDRWKTGYHLVIWAKITLVASEFVPNDIFL